ncbi:MAG: phosphoglucosamine mutase, partial [Candidatus Caldatribacteriota bacterium]|nr:phosphoglucosamine mutase [Candidatus Caldatribacteriota bacterium]
MKRLFGTDGIRGIANREPITAETAFQIGRAGAYLFKDKEDSKILIGRDTRISGDMLESALIAGICSLGVNVLRAGIVPTPAVAYLNKIYNADCGIVISASHNPYDNNGIKYIGKNGFKFTDSEEEAIEKIYFKNQTKNNRPTGKNIGCIKNLSEAIDKYIQHIKATITPFFNIKGYKIVIDCANGALYKIAPQMFHDLGANVISINDKPNGININLNCGATNTSSLQKEVLKHNAELGL